MNKKQLLKEQLVLRELNGPSPWTPGEEAEIYQEIEESNQDILAQYSPKVMAARISSALDKAPAPPKNRQHSLRLLRWTLPLTALAAAFLVFILPGWPLQEERLKGEPVSLMIFRQEADGPHRLADQALAKEGDRLQISLRLDKPSYVLLSSRDGRGTVTVHLPAQGTRSERLDAGEALLPFSYVLDDAPNFETFTLATSSRPFVLGDAGGDIKEIVLTLRKEARR